MRHEAVTIYDLQNGVLAFDLIDILQLAKEEVLASTWRCRHVEAFGTCAEDLHRALNEGSTLSGAQLLRFAAEIHQIIDGDFEARRPAEDMPWVIVRAVDSSFYVVSTSDSALLAKVRNRFQRVYDAPEEVDIP